MYITTEANWNLRSLLRIVLLRQLFIYDFTTGSALWFLASQMIHKRSIEERWTSRTVCRAQEIERCKTPQVVYWFLGFSKWLNWTDWTAHNEPQHHGRKKNNSVTRMHFQTGNCRFIGCQRTCVHKRCPFFLTLNNTTAYTYMLNLSGEQTIYLFNVWLYLK